MEKQIAEMKKLEKRLAEYKEISLKKDNINKNKYALQIIQIKDNIS